MAQKLNSVYYTQGKGHPLIFLHGLGASIHQPVSLLDDMKNKQLITLDFPGHGKSQYPTQGNEPSFDFYTDELLGLMDHLKIERASVGGISMGSGISLSLASRHPERVKSLILVRPAWLDQDNPPNLRILLKAAELIPKQFGRTQFERLDSFMKIKTKLPAAAMSLLGLFDTTQQKSIHKVLYHLVNDHPLADYSAINAASIPTCIIGNQNDPLHPFEMVKKIHSLIENSSLHKVTSRYKSNSKHGKEVRTIISKFLKTL